MGRPRLGRYRKPAAFAFWRVGVGRVGFHRRIIPAVSRRSNLAVAWIGGENRWQSAEWTDHKVNPRDAVLDLNHPMTKHIFAAARAEDAVLIAAKHMTVAARQERLRLRDGCAPAFVELRKLAHDHFADCSSIPPAIEELERAAARLATLPGVPDLGPPAEYKCPACGADLDRRGKYGFLSPNNPTDIYCSPCLQIIMPPLSALRSIEGGFGTEAI
jgi:hypothetical protein